MVIYGNLSVNYEIDIELALNDRYALDIYWTDYTKKKMEEIKNLKDIIGTEW